MPPPGAWSGHSASLSPPAAVLKNSEQMHRTRTGGQLHTALATGQAQHLPTSSHPRYTSTWTWDEEGDTWCCHLGRKEDRKEHDTKVLVNALKNILEEEERGLPHVPAARPGAQEKRQAISAPKGRA